jgi:hypothetical protein
MLLRSRKLTVVLVFIALYSVVSFAQAPAPAHRPTSTPYTGDPSIFDRPGRAERLQIKRVMDILGIAPGRSVADIGAGSGFFTDHGVGREVVVREMKEAGYKLVRQEDFVKDGMDYFLVFAAE